MRTRIVETVMRTVLFVLLVMSSAVSGAEARWGLRWRAPDECISPAELAARVEQRLGRPVFGLNPDFRVDGLLEAQAAEPKWKVRITVVSAAGDVVGSREVTGAGSCRSLDERIAFVVAVSIDANITEAAPPTPAPPVVAEPKPEPPPRVYRTPGAVWVELESDEPSATLMRVASQGYGSVQGTSIFITTVRKECVAPCGEFIESPSADFYIAGKMTTSSTFSLTAFPDGLKVKVKAGSLGARGAGVLLTSIGAATALVGGLFALIGGLTSGVMPGVQNPYGGMSSTFQTMGLGMLIGGGAALAGGIPLIAFSGTKLEFFPATAPAAISNNPNVTEL